MKEAEYYNGCSLWVSIFIVVVFLLFLIGMYYNI